MDTSEALAAIREIHSPDGYVYPTLAEELPQAPHTCIDCYDFTDNDDSVTRYHVVPGCAVCGDGEEPLRWPCPTALLAGAAPK